jgi:hypothetical protein
MQSMKSGLADPGIGAAHEFHYLPLCRKTASKHRRSLQNGENNMRIAHQIFEVAAIGVMVFAFATLFFPG